VCEPTPADDPEEPDEPDDEDPDDQEEVPVRRYPPTVPVRYREDEYDDV
jgi:hypothetical protein